MSRGTIALASICALDRPLEEVARAAATAGFEALEVTARRPHLDPEDGEAGARRAAAAVRDAGLKALCHGAYLGRPTRLGREAAEQDVAIAEALGARFLRVWAERVTPEQGGEAALLSTLRHAADRAATAGIEVVVERHLGSLVDEPDAIVRLLDAVGRPNVTLNYQPLDALPIEAVPAQPEDARRLAPLSRYMHLKNYRVESGRLVLAAALDEGAIDTGAVMEAAREAGYTGPWVVEFLPWDPRPLEARLGEAARFVRSVVGD